MRRIENYYLKDDGTHECYMSGRPIPCDSVDNVCRNIHFVTCDFHPQCKGITFENCIFERCTLDFTAYRTINCAVILKCDWCENAAVKRIVSDSGYPKFHICADHLAKIGADVVIADL